MGERAQAGKRDTSVGTTSSRLVLLRGNSGSGKSAVAAALRAARPRGTLAVVGQDHVRRTVLGTGDDRGTTAIGLMDLTVRYALDHGFDVVVEGILHASRYGEMVTGLRRDHRGLTRCYLYDLPFEETVRRHGAKGVSGFGEDEMRSWWHGFQPVEGLDESVIRAHESLDDAVARILRDAWDTAAPAEPAAGHYRYDGDAEW